MKKLVVLALVITILSALGYLGKVGTHEPVTLSVGASTSQVVDDIRPKRIVPRPEPSPKRASRHRHVTKSEQGLTDGSVWYRLGQCESSNDPTTNTGNGYYGLYQFDLPSWHSAGGTGYPHNASRAEQLKRAKIWKSKYGWNPWPACARKLGLKLRG